MAEVCLGRGWRPELERLSKELGLRNGKLALAHANRQAMGAAQLQDVLEMLNMR